MDLENKRYQYLKDWRKRTKQRMVDAFDGKCGICGYNKCKEALEFHHIDPTKKDFTISKNKFNNWEKLVKELKKCICICSNCHKEIHNEIIKIPIDVKKFNENYNEYRVEKEINYIECPVCKKLMEDTRNYCSMDCFNKIREKVDWKIFDLNKMILTSSILEISKIVGVSNTSIQKRLKKLNLPFKRKDILKYKMDAGVAGSDGLSDKQM